METAIKKAIEGGYRPKYIRTGWTFRWDEMSPGMNQEDRTFSLDSLFLDPLFWQALGKSLGWDKRVSLSYSGYEKDDEGNPDGSIDEALSLEEWEYQWHRLIDSLAEGKDIDSFFNSLTN